MVFQPVASAYELISEISVNGLDAEGQTLIRIPTYQLSRCTILAMSRLAPGLKSVPRV